MEWFVPTRDGRTLAVEDAGDRDGRPVMVHVGTPNSRRLYGRTVSDAAARGLRLISYDRPGYGDSTPHPGVEAWLLDDEGHETLRENHIGQVHAWLADRL